MSDKVTYTFIPRKDITTYELALCVNFSTLSNNANLIELIDEKAALFFATLAHATYSALPKNCKRHYFVADADALLPSKIVEETDRRNKEDEQREKEAGEED